jgi:UDP-4-amino-4,6-dideoxy-N-acetyl-beta-L-altrosamine transaminase
MALVRKHEEYRREELLPYCRHDISEAEIEAVVETLRSSWLTTGPRVQEFQQQVAAYVGAEHAVAVNSATAGLHLAVAALGIGPGDEVITTPMTFCATAEVVEYQHARPVFVDIAPDTHNIDVERIEAAITPRTKALMPVHFAGHPCDMDAIRAVAERHGLPVIEDAAHAIGARHNGRMVGADSDVAVYSFYATKNLTTAEGGMVVCRDAALADRLRILALHGISSDAWKRYSAEGSWFYEVRHLGFKYNMTDIAATLGLGQLARLEAFNARRRAIAARYDAAFGHMPGLTSLAVRPEVLTAAHLYVIKLDLEHMDIDRARFIELLTKEERIGASVHFIPVHMHPYYREKYSYFPGAFPIAEDCYRRSVSLPLYPKMSDTDVDDVIAAVSRLMDAHWRG